jgi:parallel beta-helix repeat protein/cysteine-rich repeat protein
VPPAPPGNTNACRNGGTQAECTYCGDGIPQTSAGEQCDDGNSDDDDSCHNDCTEPAHCGETTDPCVVTVTDPQFNAVQVVVCGPASGGVRNPDGRCQIHVDENRDLALQVAIDAANDGDVITVEGRCSGPIRITERAGLTIQGVAPDPLPEGCADGPGWGPTEEELTSTIDGDNCDSSDISDCETIKVTESPDVTIQFLNIVKGVQACVEYKRSSRGVAYCNCIERCKDEGIELDKSSGDNTVLRNLVKENGRLENGGIRVHDTVRGRANIQWNMVRDNYYSGIHITDSSDNMIESNKVSANLDCGIVLEDGADHTTVSNNYVEANDHHGIYITDSSDNTIESNMVSANQDCGILLEDGADDSTVRINDVEVNAHFGIYITDSDGNTIDSNTVHDNAMTSVLGSAWAKGRLLSTGAIHRATLRARVIDDVQDAQSGCEGLDNNGADVPGGSDAPR